MSILVIEDEAALREVIVEILELSDITTFCAASGEDGVSLFRENAGQIRAVFLDMHMPGMGGKATFDVLRELDAQIPIIIMSGRPQHIAMADFDVEDHLSYLEKPFTLDAIVTKVDEVLNAT